MGFELEIPASERPQIYALDRAATGIGQFLFIIPTNVGRRYVQFVGFYSELHSAVARLHRSSVSLESASKCLARERRHEVSWRPENIRRHLTKY